MKRLLIPLLFLGALTLMPNSAQASGSRYGFSVGFGGHSGFASFNYGHGGYGGHGGRGYYGHGGYYGRGYYGNGFYRNRYAASAYFAPSYFYYDPVYYAPAPVVYVEPAPYYAYPRYYRSSRIAPRFCPQGDLKQPQPTGYQGARQRHGVFDALDRDHRDDRRETKKLPQPVRS